MNDIQRLLAAAALVTFASVGCSSSGSGSSGGSSSGTSGDPNPPPNPNPPPAGAVTIAKAANDAQFRAPFDATPDPGGKVIYFTAMSLTGGPAVFKVGADGQGLTQLFAGDPLVSPFGISITDDGKTLVIADSGAESDTYERGALFTLGVGGGTPAVMEGTQGTLPRGVEVRGDSVYFTGTSGTAPAKVVGAVYKMPAAGGSPTVLASGDPLRQPSGIAVSKTGDVYVLDAAGSSTHHASVFKIAGGAPTELARDIVVGFPSGLALSGDESMVLVSALDDALGTDAVYTVPVAGGDMKLLGDAVQATIGKFVESSGLHRARNTGVFAWADARANKTGTVYVLK